jgi:hypothetical protein
VYGTFESFKADYLQVADRYEALTRALHWLGPPDPKAAYELYKNATKPSMGLLVMGRTNIGRKEKLAGHAIDEIELFNFGATNDGSSLDPRTASGSGALDEPSPTRATLGAVLHYPTGWHFLMNDSWILGGVHGRVEFHLASPRVAQNLFDQGNLTVTGRELTGLRAFGYRVTKMVNGTEIAHCVDEKAAINASFPRYWQELDRGIWRDMIDSSAHLTREETKPSEMRSE